MTPFMLMHEAVRSVFKEILAGTLDPDDPPMIEREIDLALAAQDLADHGYLHHYRSFAVGMIGYFNETRREHRAEPATAISLTMGAEQILVHPDDILVRPDGGRTLRRVSTGHRRSYEADDVGAAAFLLNYVPILGPLFGTVVFLLAGMLSFDSLWWALLPPALYFGIHLAEGETLTPMLLARRFTLNPVLVILSLVFWFWMWGVPGAILAVPMLAILKIVSDRVRPLKALGHVLEG